LQTQHSRSNLASQPATQHQLDQYEISQARWTTITTQ